MQVKSLDFSIRFDKPLADAIFVRSAIKREARGWRGLSGNQAGIRGLRLNEKAPRERGGGGGDGDAFILPSQSLQNRGR